MGDRQDKRSGELQEAAVVFLEYIVDNYLSGAAVEAESLAHHVELAAAVARAARRAEIKARRSKE